MWRIVAMGALPAALLGAGSGLFFSRDFVDYQPMGDIYLAQDSIAYTGSPPPYVPALLGGSGPFYVAPSQTGVEAAPPESNEAARPADLASASSAADKAADAATVEPVKPPENPNPNRQLGAELNARFDAQMQAIDQELKKDEAPSANINLDAPN